MGKKFVGIIIVVLLAFFGSVNFSDAQTKATTKTVTTKSTSKTLGKLCESGGKTILQCEPGETCQKQRCAKNTCTDVVNGGTKYQVCNLSGGGKELRNFTCESKDAAGNKSIAKIPTCTVGGIFDVNDPDDVKCACCGDCKLSRFLGVAIKISKWILGLSGTAALAVIVYGGLMWILSGGDPKRIETGKNALTGAVIGVIIVLGAWLMVNEGLKAMTGKGIDQIQTDFGANQK